MLTLIQDLRELELKESDLAEIFWRKEDSDGVDDLVASIYGKYLQVNDLCSSPEERERLRGLISQVVVLGAIRGLDWGLKLKDRDSKRKAAGDDQIVKCIIKHRKIVSLLLQTPKVSTRDICIALDNKSERLPWPELAKVQRLWMDHHKHATVKNAIKRARNKALENAADIKYLEAFAKKKRPPELVAKEIDVNR
jgi:hypothetical protein